MNIKQKQLEISEMIQTTEKEISKARKKSDKLTLMTNDYKIQIYNLREKLMKLRLELIEISKTEKIDNPPTK
jgi:hypothetical protein